MFNWTYMLIAIIAILLIGYYVYWLKTKEDEEISIRDARIYKETCRKEYLRHLHRTLSAFPKNRGIDDKDDISVRNNIVKLEREIMDLREKYHTEQAEQIL